MKTTSTFHFLKHTCIFSALVCAASFHSAFGQPPATLAVPGNADQTQFTTGATNQLTGVNAAAMAYTPAGAGPIGHFFATATYDGVSAFITVTDPGLAQTITITANGTMAGTPDIIIGDNNMGGYTAGQDFIVAICYLNAGGNIEVEYHSINDDGTNLTYGSFLNNNVLGGYAPITSNVHMDVIAEFNNMGITGFPFCDNFVLTWDDYTGGGYAQVWGVLGNLNSQSLGTPQAISPSGSAVYGIQADVAAIQRHISGFPASVDKTAWITYLDAGGANTLYLTEYDFTTNAALSTITLDNGTFNSTNMFLPRIDAFDYYTTFNNPAHYKVVQQALNSGNLKQEIRTYDNNTIGWATPFYVSSQFVDVSVLGIPYTLLTPPYHHFNPTVAGSGANYNVQHPTQISGTNYGLFVEPINQYTSMIANPPNRYYWVNSNSAPPSLTALSGGSNAVCSPPNQPALTTVYVWGFFNGTDMEIAYKDPTGYAFKNAPAVTGNATISLIYPNPAANLLNITNTQAPIAATGYKIIDMTGKVVQEGNMQPVRTTVDVASLVNGTYIIQTYTNNLCTNQEQFTKN